MNTDTASQVKKVLEDELQAQGISTRYLAFMMPQVSLETAGFKSRVSSVNNLSGIKFNKHGYCYDSGIKSPEGDNYAAYSNYNQWAKDYIRILKAHDVFSANTIDQWANKLHDGGYFTAKLEDYKKAMRSWLPQLKKMFSDVNFDVLTGGSIALVFIGIIIAYSLLISK